MPDNPADDTRTSADAADYGPPEDPMTYDETGDEAGRGRMVLLLAVVFVVAAVVLLYVVFQQGVRTGGRNAPPVIVADIGPEKIKPEDPGGLEVPHQDKTVYDRVSGEDLDRVERLLPEPEEPVDVSGLRTGSSEPIADVGADSVKEPVAEEPVKPEPVKVKTIKPQPKPTPVTPAPEATATNKIETIDDLIQSLPDTEDDPIGNSVAEVDTASVNRVSGTIPSATSGAYVVQVGSFKGAEMASGGWEALVRKNSDLLGELRPDIQLADLGARGVYYRLRIGPFETKEDAQNLCVALKARRQDCLVRPT
jgi:hypothetical protein